MATIDAAATVDAQPLGKPSVTKTTATLREGVAFAYDLAYSMAPLRAGTVGVFEAGVTMARAFEIG